MQCEMEGPLLLLTVMWVHVCMMHHHHHHNKSTHTRGGQRRYETNEGADHSIRCLIIVIVATCCFTVRHDKAGFVTAHVSV
jgi:hypothetical protein